MSDRDEDQSVADTEVTESPDQPLSAWTDPAGAPRWSAIAGDAEISGPAPADPGSSQEAADPGSSQEAAEESQQATQAGRSRRPSSLRAGVADTARSPAAPPQFPSAPAIPSAPAPSPQTDPQPPVSESASAGRRRQMPTPSALLGRLQSIKIPGGTPSTDRLPIEQVSKLVKERPELGLGLAFAGGLVLATIVKRLGRR